MVTQSNDKRSGSVHVFAIVAVVAVLAGALGWVYWQNFVNKPKASGATTQASSTTTPAPSATSSATSAAPAPTATPAPAAPTTAKYTDAERGISFSYPSNWSVSASTVGDSSVVTVTDQAGNRVAYLETNLSGIGGAGQQNYDTLATETLGTMKFNCAFTTQNANNTYTLNYGIVSDTACAQTGAGTTGMIVMAQDTGIAKIGTISFSNYDYVNTGKSTQASISMDAAKQFVGDSEYAQLKTMLGSLTY